MGRAAGTTNSVCAAPAPAPDNSVGRDLLKVISILINVVLLTALVCYFLMRLQSQQQHRREQEQQLQRCEQELQRWAAEPTPAPRIQRSVAVQSQCTYKRGPNARFHHAYNFEGYVEVTCTFGAV